MNNSILNKSLYDWVHSFENNTDGCFNIKYRDKLSGEVHSKSIKGGNLLGEIFDEIPFENIIRVERIY